jgi:putative inorganic carbon (HCO3(-)) transporter
MRFHTQGLRECGHRGARVALRREKSIMCRDTNVQETKQRRPQFPIWLLAGSHGLIGLEWLAVAVVAPFLLFPTFRPLWTAGSLIALALLWLLRWLLRREPWPVTPFNGALLLFAIMIPVAIWASALPELTLPKAAGLVLGLAAFRAVALAVRDRRSLNLALVAFCMLGVAIIALGVAGAKWPAKVGLLGLLASFIPRLIPSLPGMPDAGIQANQIAGALTLYLPLAVALVAEARLNRRTLVPPWLALVGCVIFLAVVAGVLLLTQSRGGWIGAVVGVLALAALGGLSSKNRQVQVVGAALPLLGLVAVSVLLAYLGPYRVGEALYTTESDMSIEEVVGEITIAGRVEVWNRALYAIQDFPFTGCGLGTFRRVVHILYPLFLIAPDTDVAHAHNIFLQTALDLGLPGLIAYLALLGIAGVTCWRCARHGGPLVRNTALGLAAGLVGLHVYGLADALALGSKPGVAFWFALGLIAALPRVAQQEPSESAGGHISRFTHYTRTHPWLIAAVAFLALALLIAVAALGWRVLQHGMDTQPAIRLPLYPAAQEIEVRAEDPPVDSGWVGKLEVATFSADDPLTDVATFYASALVKAGWKTEIEAGDETSWGGIYTQNEGRSVCLLNIFDIEGETWVSIVCGDKAEPVGIPPLLSGE